MIKIYTDTSYLTQEFRKIIFPVLLDIHFTKSTLALENFQIIDKIENVESLIEYDEIKEIGTQEL